MIQAGGGESGGGGANGQIPVLLDALASPFGHYSGGEGAIPSSPVMGIHCSIRYWESVWGAYPLNWEYTFESLCEGFHDLVEIPDFWQIPDLLQWSYNPFVENSQWQEVAIPENIRLQHLDDVHWLDAENLIATIDLDFQEIEGYPKVQWQVQVWDFKWFEFIRAVVFPPVFSVIPGTPTVHDPISFLLGWQLLLGGGIAWRQKKI
jgi:hypothetical protein